jgi:hypothetical protein
MLWETKLTDLNNLKKGKSHKDLQKSYHSQGYDLSDQRTDSKYGSHTRATLTHRKSGEVLKNDRGQDFGGSQGDTSAVNTMAKAVKAHITKIGRQDKRPEAKEKRKEEAKQNKERKTRDRDPFTRRKTFKEFYTGTL